MNKSILLLTVLLVFAFSSKANRNLANNGNSDGLKTNKLSSDKRSALTLDMGMSLPLGDFGKEATGVGIDGACIGSFLSLDYAYSFKNNLAATAGISTFSLGANPKTIKVATNTIYKSGWSTASFLLGVQYTYSLKKLDIEPFLRFGSSVNSSGNMSETYSGSFVSLSDLPSYNSLAYQFGAHLVYGISNRWKINMNASYFGSNFKYESYSKNIAIANLGIGASFSF